MPNYHSLCGRFYFQPTDAPAPSPKIAQLMKDVQDFYRTEMEKHGYDAKTFRLETDENDQVVVHTVNGQHNLQIYLTNLALINQELPLGLQDPFSAENHIRVIFLAGATRIGAGAMNLTSCRSDICGNTVFIPASNNELRLPYTAHEIGHAFGLNHNSNGANFLMKTVFIQVGNIIESLNDYDLGDYETRWLDKHPYFNDNRDNIKILPDITKVHSLGSLQIDGRFLILLNVEMKGVYELHQVQVSRIHDGIVVGWDEICHLEDTAHVQIRRSALLDTDSIRILVIDVMGNIKGHVMPIHLPNHPIQATETTLPAAEFRVRGGTADDFIDSHGRIWNGAQRTEQLWGGWVEKAPLTAEIPSLTADAQTQAKNTGYDVELFYAVSWAQFPNTINYQFKTGNGFFDVTYLVGEHWSPNNRGFDIIIENKTVESLYVTPGQDEIDIKTYEAIEVSDSALDLHFVGNRNTGAGDLNPMFSALEVVPSETKTMVANTGLTVDPKAKLTGLWATLKLQ